MYRHDDCMCKQKEYDQMHGMEYGKEYDKKPGVEYSKEHGVEYAKAYILPQKYENLFSCKESFNKGTIFEDLYKPYMECKKKKY